MLAKPPPTFLIGKDSSQLGRKKYFLKLFEKIIFSIESLWCGSWLRAVVRRGSALGPRVAARRLTLVQTAAIMTDAVQKVRAARMQSRRVCACPPRSPARRMAQFPPQDCVIGACPLGGAPHTRRDPASRSGGTPRPAQQQQRVPPWAVRRVRRDTWPTGPARRRA